MLQLWDTPDYKLPLHPCQLPYNEMFVLSVLIQLVRGIDGHN
jgi:hypothetical protein